MIEKTNSSYSTRPDVSISTESKAFLMSSSPPGCETNLKQKRSQENISMHIYFHASRYSGKPSSALPSLSKALKVSLSFSLSLFKLGLAFSENWTHSVKMIIYLRHDDGERQFVSIQRKNSPSLGLRPIFCKKRQKFLDCRWHNLNLTTIRSYFRKEKFRN